MKAMPKNWCIKIHSLEYSKAVQERLFEIGYTWHFGSKRVSNVGKTYIGTGWGAPNTFGHSENDVYTEKGATLITLEDLYTLPGLPSIEIGGNIVEFYPEYIKVGCTMVSNEKVKEVYNRIIENEGKK